MPSKISKKNNNKKGKKSKKYSRKTNKKYNNGKSRKLQRGGSISNIEPITPLDFASRIQEAESGSVAEQYNLGLDYLIGRGTEKNETEGVRYLKMAIEQGDIDATLLLGKHYYNKQNYSEAFNLYKKPADADDGNAEARYIIGMIYKEGHLGKKNEEEGLRYLKLAADQGYTRAQYKFGINLFMTKNYSKAFEYLNKAADKDDAEAQYALYAMYLKGLGVTKDDNKSFNMLRNAAENGYYFAQYDYGMDLMEKGDQDEAFRFFKEAADNGHAESQFMVGMMYYQGDGTVKNENESLRYLQMAVKNNHPTAKQFINNMKNIKRVQPVTQIIQPVEKAPVKQGPVKPRTARWVSVNGKMIRVTTNTS